MEKDKKELESKNEIQLKDGFEIVICPRCQTENVIIPGTCTRCIVCYEKIGSCDE